MKTQADITRGWLKKAQSDIKTMEASFDVGAYDATCFHAQQAAEKYLKAFLFHAEIAFPFTHNLEGVISHIHED